MRFEVVLVLLVLAVCSFVAQANQAGFVRRHASCVSSGDPHYSTFDGARYDYYGVGELLFARWKAQDEQINIETAKPFGPSHVSYTVGVAFRIGKHKAAVQLQASKGYQGNPTLYIDGHRRGMHNGARYHSGDISVHLHSGRLYCTIKSVKTHTRVSIYRSHRHMDVVVHVDGFSSNPNKRSDGMCGVFDGNRNNDIIDRLHNAGYPSRTVPTWAVRTADSLFKYHAVSQFTPAQRQHWSLIRLAKGNQKLLQRARHACASVHAGARRACTVDYIEGGGPSVVAEAERMRLLALNRAHESRLKRIIRNQKFRERRYKSDRQKFKKMEKFMKRARKMMAQRGLHHEGRSKAWKKKYLAKHGKYLAMMKRKDQDLKSYKATEERARKYRKRLRNVKGQERRKKAAAHCGRKLAALNRKVNNMYQQGWYKGWVHGFKEAGIDVDHDENAHPKHQ